MDKEIRFGFITGISKFSRVGIFSELNQLVDLTLNSRFAAALGLTEQEIQKNYQGYITALAAKEQMSETDLVAKMRRWYDGFRFASDGEAVYNPFSIVHLFFHQRFSNYWFESGTPNFLVKLIKERGYDVKELQQMEVEEIEFSTYDLESLAIVPLLFQTGYLTIKHFRQEGDEGLYTLAYPNYEVEHAFVTYLLGSFSELVDSSKRKATGWKPEAYPNT